MTIDSAAFEHLELIEMKSQYLETGEKDSLFDWLDQTVTYFGKRMMRRWLSAPLLNPKEINARYDAIEDLQEHPTLID
ncbi:MAG: hypothetical protein QF416_01505 [Candidatus Marinimicrobia bacterium]|nr:hypothetical protein [Candidatus Neomarinimicrobiota bacterium]